MSEYYHQSHRSSVNSVSHEDQARFENSRKIYKLLKKINCQHDCCQRCCCSGCCGCSSCHAQKCVYKLIKKLCKNALRELIEEAKASCEQQAANQEHYRYHQSCAFDDSSLKSSSCSESVNESVQSVPSPPSEKSECPRRPPPPMPFCKERRSSQISEKRTSQVAKDRCAEQKKSKPKPRKSKTKSKKSESCEEAITKEPSRHSNCPTGSLPKPPEEKCIEEPPKKPKKPKCKEKAKPPPKKNQQPLPVKELCRQPSCDRQSCCSETRFDNKTKCSDFLRCDMEKKDPYRQSQNCDGGGAIGGTCYGGYPPQKCQVSFSTFCSKNLVPNNSMCSNNLR